MKSTIVLGVGLAVLLLVARSGQAEHYTSRFQSPYGPAQVQQVCFSPAGDLIAVYTEQGLIRVLSTATGEPVREFTQNEHGVLATNPMEFGPTGQLLTVLGQSTWRQFDLATGKVRSLPNELPIGRFGIAWEVRSGKLLVVDLAPGGPAQLSGKVHIGDELEAVVRASREWSALGRTAKDAVEAMQVHPGEAVTLRLIPKGKQDLEDVTLNGALVVTPGKAVKFEAFAPKAVPNAVVISRSGSVLLVAPSDGRLTSVLTPKNILPTHWDLSADGKLLAIAGKRLSPQKGEPKYGLEIFEVTAQKRLQFEPFETHDLRGVRFGKADQRVYIGDWDRIHVYDRASGSFVDPVQIGIDLKEAQAKRDTEDSTRSPLDVRPDFGRGSGFAFGNLLMSFDVAPDGRCVAVGSTEGQVSLWSTSEHRLLARMGKHQPKDGKVYWTGFSRDGKWFGFYGAGVLHFLPTQEALASGILNDPSADDGKK